MRGEKLLTASDLAALCEVDLKTIHNWVDRGRIPHFRTPGRHLRFRAADVAEFLRAWGYAVPRELARLSSKSMLVVGSKDTFAHVTRALGEGVAIRHAAHPYDALIFAGSDPTEVFIVDVRAIAGEIDATAMLEAMHRACPQAMFVALAEEGGVVPGFARRVGRNDAQALQTLLAPVPVGTPHTAEPVAAAQPAGAPGQTAAVVAGEEPPRGAAAGGSSR
jgi:excisionase family DNA binding protein